MSTEDKDVKEIQTLPQIEEQDGSLTVGESPAPEETNTEEDASLRTAEGDDHEEEGHSEETAEEAEARRERNRKRRQENKQRRQDYVEGLKRELSARDAVINELSTRVASVERQSEGSKMAQIDAAMREAEQYYNHFKQVHQTAINEANGALATDATEKMFAAQQRYQMLTNAKRAMTQQSQQPRPLDPRMQKHAEDWMSRNQWYDPQGSDLDSDMVLKLDDRLVQEGWNPSTQEYWEELDARVKKYLPHRFNSSYNKPQGSSAASKPRVPVAGSGNTTSTASKGVYHLSAERVQALKDAGVYDDPVKRADAIRRFQEHDKRAAGAN